MNAIKDEVRVKASVASVYEALTRQAGYRGWWNNLAEVPESVGGQVWLGTTLAWRIEDAGGAALVFLEHAGWKDAAPDAVAQGWKHFLGSLRSYLETGTGLPW